MRPQFKLVIFFTLGVCFLMLGLYFHALDNVIEFTQRVSAGAQFPKF